MKYILISGSYNEKGLDNRIIDYLNKCNLNNKNISFVASTFNDYESNDKYVNKLINYFKDKNFAFNEINIIDNRLNTNKMQSKISKSDIVFLLGGDTLEQIKSIKKNKLIKPIKRSKIVIGVSAGAINMAKNVVLAKDEEDNINKLSLYKGIGITNINIEPHCDFKNKKHFKDLEEASICSSIVVMNDNCFIINDGYTTNYYGDYFILKNKVIYYNNKKTSLKKFLEFINYD